MGDLTELEQALIAFSAAENSPSTARKIREISSTIEHVIADGLSLDLVVSFLNQNGINVSKNTLKVTLYRLRKKEGKPQKSLINNAPPQKEIATPTAQLTQAQQLDYQAKIKAFNEVECDDWKGKYIALGGNPDELKDLSPAGQRNKVVKLRMKLSSENL